MDSKSLRGIASVYEAVYGGGAKEEKKDTRMVVTNADKKANTPAYQNLKKGVKGYKAADHMKEGSMDPVGKEDGDIDNDGDKDSSDKYLMKRRKAIAKAMGKDDKMKKEEIEILDKLIESEKFSDEEIVAIFEAERSIDDRLERKNKLMKKTVRKAMDYASREGEAAGHARYNMSRLGDERDKLIAKKK
tara:strand:- start:44 stop:610 length:567 start_codon:yes stop_codon:yes gene_type:complete